MHAWACSSNRACQIVLFSAPPRRVGKPRSFPSRSGERAQREGLPLQMHWTKLVVAGIAAIGGAAIAAPALATGGLQTHKMVSTFMVNPEVLLVDRKKNRKHRRHRSSSRSSLSAGTEDHRSARPESRTRSRHRNLHLHARRDDPDLFGDHDSDNSWIHCRGKKYRYKGRMRCRGDRHRYRDLSFLLNEPNEARLRTLLKASVERRLPNY